MNELFSLFGTVRFGRKVNHSLKRSKSHVSRPADFVMERNWEGIWLRFGRTFEYSQCHAIANPFPSIEFLPRIHI